MARPFENHRSVYTRITFFLLLSCITVVQINQAQVVTKLLVGEWKSVPQVLCLDCTPREYEKKMNKQEKSFGYMIYTFNHDGTYTQQRVDPKRKQGWVYFIKTGEGW